MQRKGKNKYFLEEKKKEVEREMDEMNSLQYMISLAWIEGKSKQAVKRERRASLDPSATISISMNQIRILETERERVLWTRFDSFGQGWQFDPIISALSRS